MSTQTTILKSNAVADRFTELEGLITDHIKQEVEQEAALDAAARDLRAIINHHSEERVKQFETAEARRRREESRAFVVLAKDIHRDSQRNKFLRRVIGSTGICAILAILYATGGMSGWLVAVLVALVDLFFLHNVVAYATRNKKARR